MKIITLLTIAIFILFNSQICSSQKLNNQKFVSHLKTQCDSISGNNGEWQLFYHGIVIIAIVNEETDRIKLLSPITYVNEAGAEVIEQCMQANFDNLKDVKYAIANNIIWSVI